MQQFQIGIFPKPLNSVANSTGFVVGWDYDADHAAMWFMPVCKVSLGGMPS
jgi:hypothetical protein